MLNQLGQPVSRAARLSTKFPISFIRNPWSVLLTTIVALVLVILQGSGIIRGSGESAFLSPLAEIEQPRLPKLERKEVIGFLPFWNRSALHDLHYDLLTQVIFFALQIDPDGSLKKRMSDGTREPGWSTYQSQVFGAFARQAKSSGARVLISIQALDQETIEAVVNDPQRRSRVIQQVVGVIEQKNLDGVNIDFEYAGIPSPQTAKNFTQFVKEFDNALSRLNPNLLVSVDIYADAMRRPRLWDVPAIAELVDQVIIMAYDFHRPSSPVAGPIAPLRGAPLFWDNDIVTLLTEMSAQIPLTKLILGVAYYGYEWRTTSEELYAPTYPKSGSLATYKRIASIIDQKRPQLFWDETSLSPVAIYQEQGEIRQIYYENETSLGIKYDFVNESGLAGIAIWALGYDGPYPHLWSLLAEKFPR